MRSPDLPRPPKSQDPVARRFALARDLIQRNRRQDSLAVLDSVLREGTGKHVSPRREAKVAALVGDYEKKRGNFSSAADYYAVAAEKLDAKDTRQWFRPTLGQIRALLAQPAVDDAFGLARDSWLKAKNSVTEFDAATNITLNDLRAKGRIEIAPRPLRPSVVASKLGEAFLQAGEWEIAEFFFNEALLVNPNGGCRARQALAKIALAGDRPIETEARAQEALLLGKYRAKTLSAWPLLISGRARQKKPLFTEQDRAGLYAIKAPSVRARAILVICKAIRPFDDTWMDIAAGWVGSEGGAFPAIRFELEKLMRSEARLAGVINRDQAAIALRHARTKGASPEEAISAGKAYVRTVLLAGAKSAQWELVSGHLKRVYGDAVASKAIHAMALGAMQANRHDLARLMLTQIRASLPATRMQWMKSTWALAQMEEVIKNYRPAYAIYSELAVNDGVPARFRVQSLFRALTCATVGEIVVSAVDTLWIERLIDQEADHRALLDMGRQLSLAGPAFGLLLKQAADRGTSLAVEKLAQATHPAVALGILLELNRRQFFDFGREAEVVKLFNEYAADRLDWLWSNSSVFWEWYGVVVHCVGRADGIEAGVKMAQRYLNDVAISGEGASMLGCEVGRMLVNASKYRQAMAYFEKAIVAHPNSRTVGIAYYWTALVAFSQGDVSTAKKNADYVRRSYGLKPGYAEEWRCDAQSLLILHDGDIGRAAAADSVFDINFIKEQGVLLEKAVAELKIFL